MSDIQLRSASFLTLFADGQVTADRIDDFIDAWHESGDEETRSLAEFLGMTDAEYEVFLMAPRVLPLIVRARRENRPLRDLLAAWLASLAQADEPRDRKAIFCLTNYIGGPGTP